MGKYKEENITLRRAGLAAENSEAKTILVAGGAGFLGSHLCRRLLAEGNIVVSVDNFLSGRAENIADLQNKPNFFSIEHDIIEPVEFTGPVNFIYNLACAGSPPVYQRDPVHTMKTNVFGAANLLDLAREKGARILQSSTSEVYGDPDVHPQPEHYHGNVNPFGPRACYDEGKRAAETLFYDYAVQYGVVGRVARIFNTYGPHMRPDDGRVISNFIMQALRGDDITVYGSGVQTRSFCYVDDMIEGLVRLMNSPKKISHPVNIGNPSEFTIRELAELVIQRTNSGSAIVNMPLPEDDPRQRRPDIAVANRLLNWAPSIQLDEGLCRTISYFAGEISRDVGRVAEVA